jgi:hypothetical protein
MAFLLAGLDGKGPVSVSVAGNGLCNALFSDELVAAGSRSSR